MSRKVILLKFGSSVLQSRTDLPTAVHEIYRWIRQQYRVVAVVSAFAGETDRLLATVSEYGDANPEAMARIVATGEEVATAFLALELDRFGIPSQVLDPSQIQLIVETVSNDTEPVSADTSIVESVLEQGTVAVIPGFVARDRSGRVALLGRGGSDLSALFLAKQLNARCRLIKDVDGIYNADPVKYSDARRFAEISFGEAASVGGKVVQPKAIAFGRKTGVAFEVAAAGEEQATLVGAGRSVLAASPRFDAPLRVGLLGLGTVGLGVFRELWKRPDLFEVTGIAVRRPELHVQHAPRHLLTRNCWEVIRDADLVVELIGGSDPAGDLVHAALRAGKPVVTANKLLVANDMSLGKHHAVRYSAAVGGAVPALEAVRALVKQTSIVSLSGVLNGTCNYILDRMAAGCSWDLALAEAQAHGFAEQDPRADVSGADTVCKLQLLARQAFPGMAEHPVRSVGIDGIDADWVQSAARHGRRARLIGTARLSKGRVHLEVEPTLVDAAHPFAQIRSEQNCLLIETGQPGARHVWTGRGAGRWPTTAAVMADLLDLSRELRASGSELRAPSCERWTEREVPQHKSSDKFLGSTIELRDPRQPSVSPFLSVDDGCRSNLLGRCPSELTTATCQPTTASGGAA
jgi:homoserine dehydrogenase